MKNANELADLIALLWLVSFAHSEGQEGVLAFKIWKITNGYYCFRLKKTCTLSEECLEVEITALLLGQLLPQLFPHSLEHLIKVFSMFPFMLVHSGLRQCE